MMTTRRPGKWDGAAMASLLSVFLLTFPAAALEEGDILVRLRGINVAPLDSSSQVPNVGGDPRLGVSPHHTAELDFTYMWTDNIGTELILGGTKNKLTGENTIGGLEDVGHTRLIPPTLTLQYHFWDKEDRIRPYLGVGINYTIAYDTQMSESLNGALGGGTKGELENTFGYALQGGVDLELYPGWYANLDVKYIQIEPELKLTTTSSSTQAVTVRRTDVNINPIIVGVGVGMTF